MESYEKSDRTIENVRKGLLVSGYLLMAIGIICLGSLFFYQKGRLKNTTNWKKTECVVHTGGITAHKKKPNMHYYWFMEYTYEFNGKEYTSEKYSLLQLGPYYEGYVVLLEDYNERKEEMTDENSEQHSKGLKRICYVNPDNPKEAVLALIQPTIKNTLLFIISNQLWQVYLYAGIFFGGLILRESGVQKRLVCSN